MILIEHFKLLFHDFQILFRHITEGKVKKSQKLNSFSHLTLLLIFLLNTCESHAEETRRLELGLGLAGASLPHYRGSDQKRDYLAPFPYVRYDGKRLKVNRDGGQFYFYYHSRFRIDVSAALSPPVFSEDNHARKGMEDLHPVIELGPRAQVTLYQSEKSDFWVRASFPIRAAIASDFKDTRSVGWVFSPYIQVHINHKRDADFSIGPMWASEEFHDYVYEVNQKDAMPDRPAYDAKEGYSGTRFTFTTGHRYRAYWFGFFARYDDLSGATFDDSPLVRREESFMAGAVFSTILYSEEL